MIPKTVTLDQALALEARLPPDDFSFKPSNADAQTLGLLDPKINAYGQTRRPSVCARPRGVSLGRQSRRAYLVSSNDGTLVLRPAPHCGDHGRDPGLMLPWRPYSALVRGVRRARLTMTTPERIAR